MHQRVQESSIDTTGLVCAVIVTYRPDPYALSSLVAALRPQVGCVVVVDNSPACSTAAMVSKEVGMDALLQQKSNVGLAAAQNAGIAWARARSFLHVLLLDQDSQPAAGMVVALLETLQGFDPDRSVAAVGPRFHDAREKHDAPFVRIGFPFNRKLRCADAGGTIAADFLIGSGMLIPLAVIDAVGGMDAGLFIDNVDLEWSFRVRAAGYTLLGVCDAHMQHRLGDARRHLRGVPRGVVVHAPLRLYYMMRNRVLLYRMQHVPRVWVAQDVPRVLVKLFLFGVLIGPRRRNLRCMLRGLWDGAHGRNGPAPLFG